MERASESGTILYCEYKILIYLQAWHQSVECRSGGESVEKDVGEEMAGAGILDRAREWRQASVRLVAHKPSVDQD